MRSDTEKEGWASPEDHHQPCLDCFVASLLAMPVALYDSLRHVQASSATPRRMTACAPMPCLCRRSRRVLDSLSFPRRREFRGNDEEAGTARRDPTEPHRVAFPRGSVGTNKRLGRCGQKKSLAGNSGQG